ncbi:MAG: ketoacyl-ACP synthase III [Desulfobacterales bacterium]|nr:ketoacyl-ACP synthase III [Desulfobacterales bacterium]
MGTRISGTGAALGKRIVSNEEFVSLCSKNDEKTSLAREFADKVKAENKETSAEWIRVQTGIEQRVWIDTWHTRQDGLEGPGITMDQWEKDPSSGINTSDLAAEAALSAISDAGLQPEDIDCSIWASLTADHHFPGLGNFAFDKAGLKAGIPAISIMQQCSGFVYGAVMAHSFIKSGMYKRVLVVGAEIQSVWQDLTTRGRGAAPIFGDGASAIVFTAADDNSDILSYTLGSNGNTKPLNVYIHNSACGETWGRDDADYAYTHPFMQGNKVFKHAVKGTVSSIKEILADAGLAIEDVNWFLPHQANHNINVFAASYFGSEVESRKDELPILKDDRWLSNIQKYGNLSAASIPLLIHENIKNKKIKRGDLCVMTAYGAGFNWGALLFRY